MSACTFGCVLLRVSVCCVSEEKLRVWESELCWCTSALCMF